MQLLSRVIQKDGTIFKSEIVYVTNNSLKKINAPLLVGKAKYLLQTEGSVTLQAKDKSKILYALYGGKHSANELIDDATLVAVFGYAVVTEEKVQDAIDKLAYNLEKDVDDLTVEQVELAKTVIEKLEILKGAFSAV